MEFFAQRESLKRKCWIVVNHLLLSINSSRFTKFQARVMTDGRKLPDCKKKETIFLCIATYVHQVGYGSCTQIWTHYFSIQWVFQGKKFKWLNHLYASFSLQWVLYRKKETNVWDKLLPSSFLSTHVWTHRSQENKSTKSSLVRMLKTRAEKNVDNPKVKNSV